MTTNEEIIGAVDKLSAHVEEVINEIDDLKSRLAAQEAWRKAMEAFKQDSISDRLELRSLIESMPQEIHIAVKSELYSESYRNQRQQETEMAMAKALRKVFNVKSVAGFFGMLVTIIVFAERIYGWMV